MSDLYKFLLVARGRRLGLIVSVSTVRAAETELLPRAIGFAPMLVTAQQGRRPDFYGYAPPGRTFPPSRFQPTARESRLSL